MTSILSRGRPYRHLTLVGFALAALVFVGGPALAKTKLVVYSSYVPDELELIKERLKKRLPDIEISILRASSGVITARFLAEGERTQADIIWGVAASNLMQIAATGLAHPYAPKGLESISPKFRDKADPPTWVGMAAYLATVCFNRVEAAKFGLPKPRSWRDLTKPVYKGHLTATNPNSSGSGFIQVSSWLQLFGEEGGWRLMDALHRNVAVYTHSGSKACRMAAAGEYPIGLSVAARGVKLKQKGAPIDLIYPREGIGWDMEGFMIVKGAKNLEAAKRLADWSVTREANELYNRSYLVVAMPGVAKPVNYLQPNIEEKFIDNDFVWAATNRKRILTEWQRRYGPK